MPELSDKFKYREREMETKIGKEAGQFLGIRIDGRAFHTFTKKMGFERPYDTRFRDMMNAGAMNAVKKVFPTVVTSYVQSDEISIILDLDKSGDLFSGRMQKLASLSASAVTAGFIENMVIEHGYGFNHLPEFDSRMFLLHDIEEVREYLDWRRLDCRKNSMTSAVSMYYTHKDLHSISDARRRDLLVGTAHETLPDWFFHGRILDEVIQSREVTYTHSRTGEENTVLAETKEMVWKPATKQAFYGIIDKYANPGHQG